MAQALETTFVSQLGEITEISAGDLLLVSKLEQSRSTSEYVSRKIAYGSLSTILVGDVDAKIQRKVDSSTKALSDAISANYDAILALNEKEKACESAIVKIANCVNQAKSNVQVLSSRVVLGDLSCLQRDQLLCASINSTSAYLSTAAKYISSQVSANYKNLNDDISFLSTKHNWLSTQLSTQLTSRVSQLCTQLSTTVSQKLSVLSNQISNLSDDLGSNSDRVNKLELRLDGLEIPNYEDDLSQLKHHMFEADGNVGVLCADVEDLHKKVEDTKSMRYFGAFENMAEAEAEKSNMKEGDVVTVGNLEYYVHDSQFYQFGDEDLNGVATSATIWNQTFTTVNSNKGNWNTAYDTIVNNASEWQKAKIVTKTQLDEITDLDNATIYFCTDEN